MRGRSCARPPPRCGEERGQRPRGPAGRQVDRRIGERGGSEREAGENASAEKRVREGRQERAAGRDRENARTGVAMAPYSTLAARLSSAAAIDRGVANMQPLAVEAQAVEPPGLGGAVVEEVRRERAVGRVASNAGFTIATPA